MKAKILVFDFDNIVLLKLIEFELNEKYILFEFSEKLKVSKLNVLVLAHGMKIGNSIVINKSNYF